MPLASGVRPGGLPAEVLVGGREHRDQEGAACGQGRGVLGDQGPGRLRWLEVQHCGENHADWLTEVDHACQLRIRQYLGRPGDVRGDGGYAIPGEQRTDMALHHRVIVHVSHSRIRADPLRCLMDRRARRHASAEVDELPDAPMGSRPCDGFDDERPVVSHQAGQARVEGNDPLGQFPVGGVVVLAAEQGIVHTRDIRLAGIEFHGHGRSSGRLPGCRVQPGERVGPCSRSARAAAGPPASPPADIVPSGY
jgi:hypothetical protein